MACVMFDFLFKEVSGKKWVTIYMNELLILVIILLLLWNSYLRFLKWAKARKSRPPGPLGLPWVGYLPFLGMEPHKKLWKMTTKYGNIIGLYMGTKYTVILNEYSIMKEVMTHVGALDRAPNLFEHVPQSGFLTANGHEWQEQRRFSMSAARNLGLGKGHWEELIIEEVHKFVDDITNSKGKPADISNALRLSLTSNIISILIGRKLDKKTESDKIILSRDYSEVVMSYMGVSSPATVIPGMRKLLEILKISGYDKAAKTIRNFHSFIREEIERHKTAPHSKDVPDFIHTYLKKQKSMHPVVDNNHSFTENMLEGNVVVLFLGSSDTIFSSLGWLLRLMANHQDVQEKVYNEIMTVLGKDGIARFDEKHKIPYTFAVLMESQRYSCIVPLSTTRRANQDIPIRNFVIPKGSEITANLWVIHNDPNNWEHPDKFMPDRFLTENGSKLKSQILSFVPFSIGRRNCPGETIAWIEILVYFTEIVKKFKITLPPGYNHQYKIINGLVAQLEPCAMCYKER